jgi:hypothetical protein
LTCLCSPQSFHNPAEKGIAKEEKNGVRKKRKKQRREKRNKKQNEPWIEIEGARDGLK